MQRNRGKQQNGKDRDLKKIGDIKGIFHARIGTIKDRNSKDLSKVKDIKKMWQEYTEELYKKGLNNPGNHNGVITHLEPDIPECEVKWALGSITTNSASGGDRIPAELFKILKDAAVTLNMSAHLENSAVATGLEKNQFSFQSQRRAMSKNVQTNTTELISHASKVMFKIHQAGLQQYMN